MRIGLVALSLFTLAAAVAEAAADGVFEHGERVALWPDGAPEGKGSGPEDTPSVAIHFPAAENATGTAIIVNPGGGYRGLASYHEGTQIARWLNQVGITAMILRYRLMPRYHTSAALLDAQRAVRFVRHHAERIGISTSRIGMMGFSAGGHLTTWAGTDFAAGNPTDRGSDQSGKAPDRIFWYPYIRVLQQVCWVPRKGSTSVPRMYWLQRKLLQRSLSMLMTTRWLPLLTAPSSSRRCSTRVFRRRSTFSAVAGMEEA